MRYLDPKAESLRSFNRFQSSTPFPFKALALLIVGVILTSFQLGIQIHGLSLNYIPLSVGALLAAYGGMGIAIARIFPRSNAATTLVVLAIVGLVLKATALSIPLGETLSQINGLCFSLAFILSSSLLSSYCESNGWTVAQRSWKRTLIAAYALASLQALGLIYIIGINGLGLTPFYKYESHNIFLIAVTLLAAALPYFLAIHALQAMFSQSRDKPTSFLQKIVSHKFLTPAFALLILSPVLLMVPSYIHYTYTPSFDQYLSDLEIAPFQPGQPERIINQGSGYNVLAQVGTNFSEEEEVPTNHSIERHVFEIDLTRGENPLFKLTYEIKAKVEGRNELLPPHIEVNVLRSFHDPRFTPIIKTLISCNEIELDPNDFKEKYDEYAKWLIPHVIDITLIPRRGNLQNSVYLVENVPVNLENNELLELAPATSTSNELPPSSFNWRSVGSFDVTSLYESHVYERDGVVLSSGSSSFHRSIPQGKLEFSTSEGEYSFNAESKQTLSSDGSGSDKTNTRSPSQSLKKT